MSTHTERPAVEHAAATDKLRRALNVAAANEHRFDLFLHVRTFEEGAKAKLDKVCRAANGTRIGRRLRPSGVRFMNQETARCWSVVWALTKEDHLFHFLPLLQKHLRLQRSGFYLLVSVPMKRTQAQKAIKDFLQVWRCNAGHLGRGVRIYAAMDELEVPFCARFRIDTRTPADLLAAVDVALLVAARELISIEIDGKAEITRSCPDWVAKHWTVNPEFGRSCRHVVLFGDALKDTELYNLFTLC